jgi:hypothetical protein
MTPRLPPRVVVVDDVDVATAAAAVSLILWMYY